MPTTTLLPNSTVANTTTGGDHTAVDEGIASADGTALTFDNGQSITMGFPSPSGNLTVGAGLQSFRVRFRRTSGSGGFLTIALYESGSLVSTLANNIGVTGTFATYTQTWNASLLSDGSGANVELRVAWSAASPDAELDAAEWIADYTPAGQPMAKRHGGIPGMARNKGVW